MVRKRAEAGGGVWLTNVPTAGDLAHRAGAVLRGSKNQPGSEQHCRVLKDPLIGKSLLRHKPERLEALGLVFWLALLRWRLMARSRRHPVDTTGTTRTGGAKTTTGRPTACMRVTTCSGRMVVTVDQPRHLTRALASVPPPYLTALRVQAPGCTTPTRLRGVGFLQRAIDILARQSSVGHIGGLHEPQ